jgi:Proton-conducting membrane transporter
MSTVNVGIEIFLFIVGGLILLSLRSSGFLSYIISKKINAEIQEMKEPKRVLLSTLSIDNKKDTLIDNPLSLKYLKENNPESIQRFRRLESQSNLKEYSLIILFTTLGASFLISRRDLVSIYLSLELQSFAVYILARMNRNSESRTRRGLKYFLLGALSSTFILLGSRFIYGYTGLTQLNRLEIFLSVPYTTILSGRDLIPFNSE